MRLCRLVFIGTTEGADERRRSSGNFSLCTFIAVGQADVGTEDDELHTGGSCQSFYD